MAGLKQPDSHRHERIAETLRGELAEIINYELEDPRIQTVAVTEVFFPPGGKQAHVRLAIEGSSKQQADTLVLLDKAIPFIRQTVAERIDMFRMPELKFFSDLDPGIRAKQTALMRRIRRGRPKE
jgi:ribosome-binding factor A